MENTITVIEDHLDGFLGEACLVKDQGGNYFVVSTITGTRSAQDYGSIETMAFRADENGNILDWLEVAGGAEMTRKSVLEALAAGDIYLADDTDTAEPTFDSEWYPEDDWEDWYREDASLIEYDNSSWS